MGTQTLFYFRAVGPNGWLPAIPLKGDMPAVINVLQNPVVALCARIFVAGVILYAGLRKIGDLSGMARVVENYPLFPASLADPIAIVLPGVDSVTGLCLIAGLLMKGSRLIATMLILFFLAGILWVSCLHFFPILLQFADQGSATDPEGLCGFGTIALVATKCLQNDMLFHIG